MENNSKQIYKNTLFLYLRQFIVLFVTLFTTRIVLNVLGEDDYGIYNLVAGVVIMLNIVTATMSSATQRYLSIGVSKADKNELMEVFSTSMCIYLTFALFCILLGETLGLWFLKTQLSIPSNRMSAAIVVYHFAIFSFVINVLKTPYNAVIIAFERMSVYAYFSIFTVMMQMLMVLLISVVKYDSLVVYAGFMAFSTLITFFLYSGYCRINLKVSTLPITYSKFYFKELFSFSFWSLFGSVATLGVRQTMNIFLNMFLGVKLNASSSVATKLSTAAYTLVEGFTTAYTPQIYKQYAANEHNILNNLISRATSISFFLYSIIMIPVYVVMDEFLALWLVNVPEYTAVFCKLLLLYLLIDAHQYPLVRLVTAIGNIRNYQLIFSIINLLNLPIMWFFFHIGYSPYSMYVIFIFFTSFTAIFRLIYVMNKYKDFETKKYLTNTVRLIFTFLLSMILSYLLIQTITIVQPFMSLFIHSIISLFVTAVTICFIGCTKMERSAIYSIIHLRLVGPLIKR